MTKLTPTVSQLKEQIRNIKKASPRFPPWMMRHDGLNLNGNRDLLMVALEKHNLRLQGLIQLQAFIRGYLARSYFHWKRMPAIFANETDFCTMDPLEEIPRAYLFRTLEAPHYGFHVMSLLNYFYKSRAETLTNPFNREPISLSLLSKWLALTRMFDLPTWEEIRKQPCYSYFLTRKRDSKRTRPQVVPTVSQQVVQVVSVAPSIAPPIAQAIHTDYPIQYNTILVFEEDHLTLYHHLEQVLTLPLNTRVHELFIDFDLCGNYTQADWFLHLNIRLLKMFYIRLRELWRELPTALQQSICTLGDPFYLVYFRHLNVSFQELKFACVRVMELITYGTHDREDQKLGIYQILIALASVSQNAHQHLNHLLV